MDDSPKDTGTVANNPPAAPYMRDESGNYVLVHKENIFWKAMEGLGTGWGMGVVAGAVIEFFADLMKPKGTPGRFKNLISSHSQWRQALDGAGMLVGAVVMATRAQKHNDKVEAHIQAAPQQDGSGKDTDDRMSYARHIEQERATKENSPPPPTPAR